MGQELTNYKERFEKKDDKMIDKMYNDWIKFKTITPYVNEHQLWKRWIRL